MKRCRMLCLVAAMVTVALAPVFAAGQQSEPEAVEPMTPVAQSELYNEAPMLAELVARGELPPVDERLPENPLVVEPLEEIGQYGGVIQTLGLNQTEWDDLFPGMNAAQGLLEATPDGRIVPELAERWEASADRSSYTIYLREGMKWSDGAPFTVDDIVFAFEDKYYNMDLSPSGPPGDLRVNGEPPVVTKIDDVTIRFDFAGPNPTFPILLTRPRGWQQHMIEPKHYLSKWHADYNDEAEALAKEEGFDSWMAAFDWHRNIYSIQNDINLPRLEPFIYDRNEPTRQTIVRNPYYYKVDTAGNQLPYVDGIDKTIVSNAELFALNALNGDADLAVQFLSINSYSLFKEKEGTAGFPFRVETIASGETAHVALYFNLHHKDEEMAELLSDLRFRQAFSLALNRDAMNEVVYFGFGDPRQVTTVFENASYYDNSWADHFADFDPDRARDLLDEIGLEQNRDGKYLLPSGDPVNVIIEFFSRDAAMTAIMEMVEADLEAAGIGTSVISQDRTNMFARERVGNEVMVLGLITGSSEPQVWAGGGWFDRNLPLWGRWIDSDGTSGQEPPQWFIDFKEKLHEWQAADYLSDEYRRLGAELHEEWVERLLAVGTVGYPPHPIVALESIGNLVIPEDIDAQAAHLLNRWRDQFYFKDAQRRAERP